MAASDVVEKVPIATGADGVIRVGGTRVTLDTLVAALDRGATAEEIAEAYPSLELPDVYQAIGYSLKHAKDLEPYFRQRQETQESLIAKHERDWFPANLRQRLLARRKSKA